MEAFADEQEVHIETGLTTGAHAAAVKGALAEVLDNFLANVVEVSPPGGTVKVWAERAPEKVSIHVVDEGPGLPDVERERAFDRFWRSSTATPGRGSGLGLAIVRQLVEASGGSARLDAATTGGVDAVVTLSAVDRGETGPRDATNGTTRTGTGRNGTGRNGSTKPKWVRRGAPTVGADLNE